MGEEDEQAHGRLEGVDGVDGSGPGSEKRTRLERNDFLDKSVLGEGFDARDDCDLDDCRDVGVNGGEGTSFKVVREA